MMPKYLTYQTVTYRITEMSCLYTYRKINAHSLNEFQINLSHEAWGNVFSNNDKDTNTIFNNFLDTFLKTFNASFPQKITQNRITKTG